MLVFYELSVPPAECGAKDLEGIVRIGGDPHEIEGACQDQKDPQKLNIPPGAQNMSQSALFAIHSQEGNRRKMGASEPNWRLFKQWWFSKGMGAKVS
jgi:hypothetical protein